jgi:Zn-finger nucleic acid-binding protein
VSAKKCPLCKTQLAAKYFRRIEMQHCQSCGGFWMQKNRLGEILRQYMAYIAKRHDHDCGLRERANPYEIESSLLECPGCAGAMTKLNYAYNSNVIVDMCEPCGGVWLDRGEIEKIASFLKNCGMPERIKQEFEEIRTLYDHHDRQEALGLLREMIVWILSFLL